MSKTQQEAIHALTTAARVIDSGREAIIDVYLHGPPECREWLKGIMPALDKVLSQLSDTTGDYKEES